MVPIIEQLNIRHNERGKISRFWLEITTSGLGNPLRVPLVVARGWEDGPVLGVIAVVHGNALNGLPVVRQLFQSLDLNNLCGTVVGIPVVNMPGFLRQERQFLDGIDLNQGYAQNKSSDFGVWINRVISLCYESNIKTCPSDIRTNYILIAKFFCKVTATYEPTNWSGYKRSG